MKKSFFLLSVFLFLIFEISAQSQTKRVLFLGNSYTNVNNLPEMIGKIATSVGDTLLYDSNTPGGHTLQGHSSNAVSLQKIAASSWDFVVLQEQSQYPSFPITQVEQEVFPYARFLDSIINAQNPCCETVFYMTWGRKNGDASNCASWPPVCTYNGMDSLLNLRYRMMAESNNAILSPVGAVWKYIREHYPSIELYSSDESHPSLAGTYAAACSFYTTLYRKDPELIHFDAGLNATVAENIRRAAKIVVYDSLTNWHIGAYDPQADFSIFSNQGNSVECSNLSTNASHFFWDFGDGNTSNDENPTHFYTSTGTFKILLTASHCGINDTLSQWHVVETTNLNKTENLADDWDIFPNPAHTKLNINNSFKGIVEYKIFNSSGIEISHGEIYQTSKTIDISNLSKGLHFIQIVDDKKIVGTRKFVKGE